MLRRLCATSRFSQARALHASYIACFASPVPEAAEASTQQWSPLSKRTGVIARKRGMTAMWDSNGARIPLTILQIENCQVTAHVEKPRRHSDPYVAVQIAASDRSAKNTTKAMLGHFEKAGVAPKRIVKEFEVTKDALLPVGTTLSAVHFVPGQFVDVVANSLGKGFAGVMKRWNFKGLRASHGVSVSHRSAGSTGQHQDPGRVFPGKKMAGRLGGKRITQQNLFVARIDTALNIIYVKGCVPGVDNAHVYISDATKKMVASAKVKMAKGKEPETWLPRGVDTLPFPAGTAEVAAQVADVIVAPAQGRNPWAPKE
ncbi:hypothetical protein BOTBODRAFT_29171 [Botryobasidium botryosum FD-172 SS1]|uniref:Large ribosomal subunit protein uL3m n=1 Tax=Botryobasidium botryosum (strain FD-172 SS1) TaxID=930990 RepID=A0A067MQ70_BOTB1|nr:hypothetical protein BOTBODRAFT_29171 [Botryobasidium botryosum FD-172 SS1]